MKHKPQITKNKPKKHKKQNTTHKKQNMKNKLQTLKYKPYKKQTKPKQLSFFFLMVEIIIRDISIRVKTWKWVKVMGQGKYSPSKFIKAPITIDIGEPYHCDLCWYAKVWDSHL